MGDKIASIYLQRCNTEKEQMTKTTRYYGKETTVFYNEDPLGHTYTIRFTCSNHIVHN